MNEIEKSWILHEFLPISRFEIIRVVKEYTGPSLGQVRIDQFSEYDATFVRKGYTVLKLWACLRHFKNTGRVFFKVLGPQAFSTKEHAEIAALEIVLKAHPNGLVDISSPQYRGKLKPEDILDWVHNAPDFPRDVILRCVHNDGREHLFNKGITYCGVETAEGQYEVEDKTGTLHKLSDLKDFRVQEE